MPKKGYEGRGIYNCRFFGKLNFATFESSRGIRGACDVGAKKPEKKCAIGDPRGGTFLGNSGPGRAIQVGGERGF